MTDLLKPFVLWATALAALVPAPLPAAAQEGAPPVIIPNYWDPHRRIDKPKLTGLTGPVRFLTAPDHPPFNFLNAQGEVSGFNVELLQAACLELDLRCTVQARAFDTLLPALRDKRIDGVAAGLALTPSLRRDAEVGDIYLHNPARFAVRRQAPAFATDGEGLKGRRVAVVANSAHAAFLAAFFKNVDVRPYAGPAQARQALKAGEVDALFADAIGLSFWLNGSSSDNCCVFRGGAYEENHFFGEGYAIVFRADAALLRQAFDYALLRLAERGVYAELYLRWFPVGIY